MYYDNLKRIRKQNKVTQTEIAKLLELSQGSYWRIEQGEQPLTAPMIIKLCEYFNVSADYLLGLTDEEKALK